MSSNHKDDSVNSRPGAALDEIAARMKENLAAILSENSPVDSGRGISTIDAFFLYRSLLGRNPSSDAELQALLGPCGTFRDFMDSLISSREFINTNKVILPPNHLWMAEVEGMRFWFNTGDRDMGVLMALGKYEPQSVQLLKKIVKKGMVCIDVGANSGFYTCLIGSLTGADGKVFAFEPMPSHYQVLVKNVKENKLENIVSSYQLASSSDNVSIEATVLSNMYIAGASEEGEKVIMKGVPVDDYVQDKVDFIKIDVEGHEIEALGGMRRIIAESKPLILSEINEYWLRTCSKSSGNDYVGYLNSLGYDVFDVCNQDEKIKPGSLNLDILDTMDVICLPR